MRPRFLLLIATLTLNGVLATLLWRERTTPGRDGVATTIPTEARHGAPDTGSAARGHSNATGTLLWSQIASDDLKTVAARLRGAGFPEKEVRRIVLALLDRRTNARRDELYGMNVEVPYWKAPAQIYGSDVKRMAALEQLYDDYRRGVREIFGSSTTLDDEDDIEAARRRYGNLPVDRLQSISNLESDFQERMSEIFRAARDRSKGLDYGPNATEEESIRVLQREMKAKLAATLSPDELQQYELRNSTTASRLRSQLEIFQPSEEEYKKLFALYRPLEDQFGQGPNDEASLQARRAAEEQIKEKVAAALGPDRYADFLAAQQSSGDKLSRLMVRLELPISTVTKVNVVRDDINQRAAAIRNDTQLADSERVARLSALADEANTRLTGTLGARGYEAYKDMKGDWILALKQPAAPKR